MGQLILRKIIKIIAIRCQTLRLNPPKSILAARAGGAYSRPRLPRWDKGDLLLRKREGAGIGRVGNGVEGRKGKRGGDSGGDFCVYLNFP